MNDNTHEIVKEIKKQFRLSMNGVVSTLQRRQGLEYKINFGIEIPRLKALASRYAKNRELADELWKDDIRECKILAIYLLPEEEYFNVAEEWIASTRFTEIADQLSMHILSRMPNAVGKALEWTSIQKGLFEYCGYMTLSHLFRAGDSMKAQEEQLFVDNIASLFASESSSTIRRCAYNALLHYLEHDEKREERIRAIAMEKKHTDIPGL